MADKRPQSSKPVNPKADNEHQEGSYLRFDLLQRIEHWTFMLSFSDSVD